MKIAIVDDSGELSDTLLSIMSEGASDPEAFTRTGVFAAWPLPSIELSALTQERLGGDAVIDEQQPRSFAALDPKNSPAEHATMLDAIGRIHLDNGHLQEAKYFIAQGLEARQALYGTEHSAVADSLNSLARIQRDAGDLERAAHTAQDALRIHSRLHGGDSYAAAIDLTVLGSIQYQRNELTAAEQSVRGALNIFETRLKSDDPIAVPYLLDLLARIRAARGDLAKAQQLYRRALDLDERTHGVRHPTYATRLLNMAGVLVAMREFEDAAEKFDTAIDLLKATSDCYPTLIDAYSNRGSLRLSRGDQAGAREDLKRALELNRTVRGERHPRVGHTLVSLGLIDLDGDLTQALEYFRTALEILTETLPPNHGFIAATLTNQAIALVELQQPAAAEPLLQRALGIWNVEYGEHSSGYATARATLGRSLFLQGKDLGQAEELLRTGLALLVATEGQDDWTAGLVRRWLTDISDERPTRAL